MAEDNPFIVDEGPRELPIDLGPAPDAVPEGAASGTEAGYAQEEAADAVAPQTAAYVPVPGICETRLAAGQQGGFADKADAWAAAALAVALVFSLRRGHDGFLARTGAFLRRFSWLAFVFVAAAAYAAFAYPAQLRVGVPGALGFLALAEFTALLSLAAAGMAVSSVHFFKRRANGWSVEFAGERYLFGSIGVMFLTSFMLLLFTESSIAFGALFVLAFAAAFFFFARPGNSRVSGMPALSVACIGAAVAVSGSLAGMSLLCVFGAALAAEMALESR
ncbi:MAG: hypothetical protein LBT92_00430 [Rickettsiales bacterium]|jgi:hypothetical protein|nr:hypothetical protein [Rickettsiales bacterium]